MMTLMTTLAHEVTRALTLMTLLLTSCGLEPDTTQLVPPFQPRRPPARSVGPPRIER